MKISQLILQLYKGKLENGIPVVIRCIPLSKKYSIRNFKLRLDLLAKLRHTHLISLLGHCIDGILGERNDSKVFLIYECVSNGNFQTYLSGKLWMYTVSFNVLNCSCSQVTLLGIVRKYEQIQSVIACCGGFKIL